MSLKMTRQAALGISARAKRIADMALGAEVCTKEDMMAAMENLEIDVRTLRSLVNGLFMEE